MNKNFKGFPKDLIDSLVCQKDSGNLELLENIEGDFVMNGELRCKKCNKKYKIKNGILIMLDLGKLDSIEMKDEIKARDKEAGNYDKRLGVRYYKEVVPTLREMGDLENKKIIEYGAGTGRITEEILKKDNLVLAIDFSFASLNILSQKDLKGEVGLVLADSTQFKSKENYFDKACSFQFYEHIPTDKQRNVFLENAQSTLKLGGRFINTVYHHDLRRTLKKQPQEGKHKGGIFFHYFKKEELAEEFKKYFKVLKIGLIDITLPLEARLKLPQKISDYSSRVFKKIPVVNKLAHLLMIKAEKNKDKIGLRYNYPSVFFKKKWFWFCDPFDVKTDMSTFFSYNKLEKDGFKRKEGLTTVVDLKRDEEAIWLKMRKSFIRKQIKRGEKNGIEVKKSKNFKEFEKIYNVFRKDKNLVKDNFDVMKENGDLFSAYLDGKMIAGGVFAVSKPFVRAWVLASLRLDNQEGRMRDIIGQANRMVIWEVIKYYREKGFEVFDLGGINPNSNKKWERTLAEFKESFGGERKKCYYYSKVYSPLLKFWIKLRNKL